MKRIFYSYINAYRGLSAPVWMLAIVMLINRTGAMVLPFLGIYMISVLGFNLKEAGFVLSFFGLGAVAGSVAGGWLTDKFGHFKIQTASLFIAMPAFLVLPYLKGITILSTGIFLLSFITEIFRPANSVSINTYEKRQNITRAFSLNRMALNLGFSIGPALGGFLAAISYHLLFYGNGISSAIAGIVFYFYFRKLQQRNTETKTEKRLKYGRSPWSDSRFIIFCILCCFYNVCFFQLLSTLPLYYKEKCLLDNVHVGLLLGFNGLVVFCLEMLLVGYSEKRFAIRSILVNGTILCALSFLVLTIGKGQVILYFSMFLLSVSEILVMPFIATIAIQRAPKGREGSYMGMNGLSFSLAHILSPLVGTFVAAHFGFQTLWVATAIFVMLTAGGFWWLIEKMR